MSTYFTGKIYAIKCNETNDVYIGSTIRELNIRLIEHKTRRKKYTEGKYRYTTSFEIVQYDSCYIELLEVYPCNNKIELERKEGEYIQNMKCVNKYVAGRTKKEWTRDNKDKILEYQKQYNIDNKEQRAERDKKNYEANREQILQCKKEYREKNKERISEKNKQKYTCVCGSNIRKSDRRAHERTKKHGDYINELQENADPVNLNEFFEQFKFKVSM